MRKKIKIDYVLVAFLYFSILVVGFVFSSTDAEYRYNQQLARGFITEKAVFFDIDDLSYRQSFVKTFSFSADEPPPDLNGIKLSPKEARDTSFVLENHKLDSGYTAVETLLISGNKDYMASIHNGVMRAVVYKGNIKLPPLLSGRFFSREECLSDVPKAVIGKKHEGAAIERSGKRFLNYMNKEYEVVGVVGLSGESAMDDIIFVNLGSLTPEEQLNGTYYIDCSRDNEAIYGDMLSKSEGLFGCGLKRRDIPMAFIDVVSGGMYMKSYMKVLMILLGVITFFSVIIQSTRIKILQISVMKIQGIRLRTIFVKTVEDSLKAYLIGTVMGVACNIGFIVFGVFSLPVSWLAGYFVTAFAAGLLMMLIWMLTVFIYVRVMNPKEVIQKL